MAQIMVTDLKVSKLETINLGLEKIIGGNTTTTTTTTTGGTTTTTTTTTTCRGTGIK
ncbi:hypothetical protein [Moorena sp. SIO3I8]|uniref:hypothetical protein n=1 Tax=Moorena sp. SIO3I8 TaxID=2607833 RepID=UPI0013BF8CED|nr:hypothetical protein [Moorena sp. SIO3I8]NEO07809.1 hypothetical protein [Moorena sp. SIO3I8]